MQSSEHFHHFRMMSRSTILLLSYIRVVFMHKESILLFREVCLIDGVGQIDRQYFPTRLHTQLNQSFCIRDSSKRVWLRWLLLTGKPTRYAADVQSSMERTEILHKNFDKKRPFSSQSYVQISSRFFRGSRVIYKSNVKRKYHLLSTHVRDIFW